MTLLDQLPRLDQGLRDRGLRDGGLRDRGLRDRGLREGLCRGLGAPSVVEGIHELLDLVRDEPVAAGEYAGLVRDCARAVTRLQALKLKLVAAAEKASVPEQSGAASASDWLASATNSEPAESFRQTKLASDLEKPSLTGTRQALGEGEVSAAHAAVIAETVRRLPEDLTDGEVATIEAALVEKAQRINPRQLRRAARRALEAIERDRRTVDAHEDAQLRDEEERARAKTRCTLHDNGDGTVSVTAVVPALAGAILKKLLDQMSSPRRGPLGATQAQTGATGNPYAEGFDWPRRRGEALVSLIEHLPTDHLSGKVAASVIVTLDADALRDGLRASGLDTGEVISAAEARRLACNAGLIPAVLGGASQRLDLGRASRFFTEAQRTAGALRHQTCAADGCEIPYAWTELHHRDPWSHGGRTDLADMVPLCGFHHQRIHDPAYHHRHRPDGAITFTRRT